MIVHCEGCDRRFQLDDARIPERGARVRCKYCQHRFRVPPPRGAQSEAGETSVASSEPDFGERTLVPLSDEVGDDALASMGNRTFWGAGDPEGVGGAPAAEPAGPPAVEGEPRPAAKAEAPESAGPSAEGEAPDAAGSSAEGEAPDAAGSCAEGEAPDAAGSSAAGTATPDAVTAMPDAGAGGEPELRFVTDVPGEEDPAAALSASDLADPSGRTPGEPGSDDSWEFADSGLSFDGPAAAPAGPPTDDEVAPESQSSEDWASQADIAPEDDAPSALGIERPGESGSLDPEVEEATSLRAVGPGDGPDTAQFEMVEGTDTGAPLELAGGADDADAPADAPAASAAPAAEPEIGSAADWDALAGAPAAAVEAPPEDEGDDDLWDFGELAPDPDWPVESDDAPPLPAPPPSRARVLLSHVGWALSLILLLAVAQGTVRLSPEPPEATPGRVELAGLSAEDVRGRFVENAHSGTLFVVSGELRNRGGSPVAQRALRVVLVDAEGEPVEGGAAPVGQALPESMVRESPVGALAQQQAILDLGREERPIPPGGSLAFQAILAEIPERAARFRLEPLPSVGSDR